MVLPHHAGLHTILHTLFNAKSPSLGTTTAQEDRQVINNHPHSIAVTHQVEAGHPHAAIGVHLAMMTALPTVTHLPHHPTETQDLLATTNLIAAIRTTAMHHLFHTITAMHHLSSELHPAIVNPFMTAGALALQGLGLMQV
jgi:hypothetical protein